MASKLSLFLAELKRRKVTRVAVAYALVGLGVIEGASMILPTLQLEAAYPFIVIFVLFGFPIALVVAWAERDRGTFSPQRNPKRACAFL